MTELQAQFLAKQAFDAAAEAQKADPQPACVRIWTHQPLPLIYVEVTVGQPSMHHRLQGKVENAAALAESWLHKARALGAAEAIPYLEGLAEELRKALEG